MRRSVLVDGLRRIGVAEGGVLFAHASMSSLGWVVGGTETVVRALLDAVGPDGTVAAVGSWSDIPLRLDEWPAERQRAYREEMPGFDAENSEANPLYGRLPERIRSWKGSLKSAHPDQRVLAIGARARWLTAEHSLDDSFGHATPFARLVEADGQVLMLGAPLRALTLLHHAEALVDLPAKRRRSYQLPFATLHGVQWQTLNDIDVEYGPFPYEKVLEGGDDPLRGIEAMARAALAAGIGTRGRIAAAECHLFPAPPLVAFARTWLELHFGEQRDSGTPAKGESQYPSARERKGQRREGAQ